MRIAGLPVDDSLNITPHPSAARPVRNGHDNQEIIGDSDGMRYVMSRVEQVAETDATVLISARPARARSWSRARSTTQPPPRRPFVVVNCAALPATLIESELFGHERGAFTGAHPRRSAASSSPTAARSSSTRSASCRSSCSRSCCACSRTARSSASAARTPSSRRADHRRHQPRSARGSPSGTLPRGPVLPAERVPITCPRCAIAATTFRARRHLVGSLGACCRSASSDPAPVGMLESYDWPGNVRELENVLQRAIILSGSAARFDRPVAPRERSDAGGHERQRHALEVERRHIVRVLEAAGGESKAPAAAQPRAQTEHPGSRMPKLGIARPR